MFLYIMMYIQGILRGFDQHTNIILDRSHECVYSSSAGVEQITLGLYLIRGDNIAVIGEMDEDLEREIDLDLVRAEPLDPVLT